MKWLVIFIWFAFTGAVCNKNKVQNCFKGRLEIKGICMNYVIRVLEGNTASLQVAKSWTDENDAKLYQNVFALASKCNFPEMEEGQEFYFTVSDTASQDCAVCFAYRPVPAERNFINILQSPCR